MRESRSIRNFTIIGQNVKSTLADRILERKDPDRLMRDQFLSEITWTWRRDGSLELLGQDMIP